MNKISPEVWNHMINYKSINNQFCIFIEKIGYSGAFADKIWTIYSNWYLRRVWVYTGHCHWPIFSLKVLVKTLNLKGYVVIINWNRWNKIKNANCKWRCIIYHITNVSLILVWITQLQLISLQKLLWCWLYLKRILWKDSLRFLWEILCTFQVSWEL